MNRPTTLTVLGILAIIFGAYGLLCTPFALLMTAGFGSEIFKEVMPGFGSGPMQIWMYASSGLAIVASLFELAAGIGLLQVKEWGRKLAIGLCVYKILFSFVSAAVQVLMVRPMMAEMMKDLPAGASGEAAMAGGMIGGVIGGAVGILFAVVLYSVLIYLLTRPEVVTACQSEPVERAYAGSL